MKIFRQTTKFSQWRDQENSSIGFVPTMGNLHAGHLSLIKKALLENERVIVSIFVNPKQFGPNEDFENYPRTLNQDLTKIEALEDSQNIVVYAPESINEIYPKDFNDNIKLNYLDNILCGKSRPGHFDGMATVVNQLFKITYPTRAYFGQKDFQQLAIIRKLIKEKNFDIEIISMPIIREESGLALSSRNQYLSEVEKVKALTLYETLNKVKDGKDFTLDANWEYLEILDADNLEPINKNTVRKIALGAYRLGQTRLIDNIIF